MALNLATTPPSGGAHDFEPMERFVGERRHRQHFTLRQAFSSDSGAHWEVNWIATFDRSAN